METSKVTLLRNAMQAYAWRTRAASTNLANLDTPDYERLSVRFEETLQESRRGIRGLTHPTETVEGRVRVEGGPALLEDELMELSDTQMRTQLASRALRDHFELIRTGILGRNF